MQTYFTLNNSPLKSSFKTKKRAIALPIIRLPLNNLFYKKDQLRVILLLS